VNAPRRISVAAALSTLLCGAVHATGVGDTVPDFSRRDLAGRVLHLSDYRGKLVLLNFWASWCGPCLQEMPKFSAWQQHYGAQGLQVIGVSMDDDAAPVNQLLARHPVSYPIIIGDARLGETFGGVLGLPESYLIDPQGRIIARFQGEPSLAKLEAQIRAQLSRLDH
jgi:cytochrome c biogenesis protein CcmG, thiol:disulfide interchange protein DsbE